MASRHFDDFLLCDHGLLSDFLIETHDMKNIIYLVDFFLWTDLSRAETRGQSSGCNAACTSAS